MTDRRYIAIGCPADVDTAFMEFPWSDAELSERINAVVGHHTTSKFDRRLAIVEEAPALRGIRASNSKRIDLAVGA